MTLIRRMPILVVVLVLVSVAGFCVSQRSIGLLFIAGIAAAIAGYVTEGPRGRTLPKWIATLLVLGVSGFTALQLLGRVDTIPAVLGRFAVWLAVIKFFDRRTPRDHGQLLLISMLLVLVGCLQTTNLLFGLILVVYVALAAYVLMLFQLAIGYERARERRRLQVGAGRGVRAPTLRPIRGRRPILDFTLFGTALAGTGLVLSVLLFTAFPRRLSGDILNPWFRAVSPARVTGFTDIVDLDASTRITNNPEVVADLEILDANGAPLRIAGPLWLRGGVLDRYRDGRWTASVEPSPLGEVGRDPVSWIMRSFDPGSSPVVRQRFRFRRPTENVFALYVPLSIESDERSVVRVAAETQVAWFQEERGVFGYEVTSALRPEDETVGAVARTPPPIRRSGMYIDSTGRVQAFAERILREANVGPRPDEPGPVRFAWDVRAAQRLARALQREPYAYTLDVGDVVRGNVDPVVHFLFESRRGHCEYFAAALVAMCHTLDIEARVVTGFLAHRYDTIQEAWVIQASDAHAWTEVRAGQYRYITVDPTPPGVIEREEVLDQSLAARIGRFYRNLEGTWLTHVVQYDDRSQSALLSAVDARWSDRLKSATQGIGDWMRRVNRAFRFGPAGYIWLGLVAFAGVLAVLAIATVLRRRRRLRETLRVRGRSAAEARRYLRQLGFYLDMLQALEGAGLGKPSSRPPLDHAGVLADDHPAVAELVRGITRLYYRARYAGMDLAASDRAGARAQVEELRRRLAGNPA